MSAAAARVKVEPGQIWEFHNLRCGTVESYELERVFQSGLSTQTVTLRNLETGGVDGHGILATKGAASSVQPLEAG